MCKSTWVIALALLGLPVLAADNKPILIGEISSYSTVPAFTVPYRNGWQMAVEEINSAGGLLGGRKLEVISRTVETLLGLVQTRSSLRVDWYIVLLIIAELVLTTYPLLLSR